MTAKISDVLDETPRRGTPPENLEALKAFLAAHRQAKVSTSAVKETQTKEQYVEMANDIYDKVQHMLHANSIRGEPAPQDVATIGVQEPQMFLILAKALGREEETQRIYDELKKRPAFDSDSILRADSSASICHLLMRDDYEPIRRAQIEEEARGGAILGKHFDSPGDLTGRSGLYWLAIEASMLSFRSVARSSYKEAVEVEEQQSQDGFRSLYDSAMRGVVACILGDRDLAVEIMEERVLNGIRWGRIGLYAEPKSPANAAVALLALALAGTDFKQLIKRPEQ